MLSLEKWKNKYWLKKRDIKTREKKFNKRLENGKYQDYHQYLLAKNSFYIAKLRTNFTKAEKIFGDYK